VVTSPLPRVVQLVTDAGAGWVVDGAVATGQLLRDLAADRPHLRDRMRAAARWSAEQDVAMSEYDVLAARVVALAERARRTR